MPGHLRFLDLEQDPNGRGFSESVYAAEFDWVRGSFKSMLICATSNLIYYFILCNLAGFQPIHQYSRLMHFDLSVHHIGRMG